MLSPHARNSAWRFAPRAALWLGVPVAITLLAWQALNLDPAPGLDSSWGLGLEMGLNRGVHFGSQLTFTYGPLGFLSVTQLWYGGLATVSFIYQLLIRLGLAAALFFSARRSFGSVGAFVLAVVVAGIGEGGIPETVIIVIVSGWAITSDRAVRDQQLICAGLGAFAAFQLLHKASIGAELIAMAVVVAVSLRGSRLRNGAAGAISFLVALLLCWLALGQPLGALPEFIVHSGQITLGYASAMGVDQPGGGWAYTAAFLGLASGIWAAFTMTEVRPGRERYGLLTLWVVFWFFTFKEGFVRQDQAHVIWCFQTVLAGMFAFRWRRGMRWAGLFSICALAAFALAEQQTSLTDSFDPTRNVSDAVNDLRTIASAHKTAVVMDRGRVTVRTADPLDPASHRLLIGHTVGIFPSELGYIWGYRLNWDPFPVMQAYSAYTSALDRMDADFLTSTRAPQRILVNNKPEIDGRLVWFDAPQTSRTMLCHYRPLRATAATMVLALIDYRCAASMSLGTVRADWAEPVPVPAPPTSHSLVFVRISGVGVGGLESLESLFYKPAERYLVVNGVRAWRLVAGTAGDGLPLRAAAGVDFPPPFNISPQAKMIAVTKRGQAPTGGKPITYNFYTETRFALKGRLQQPLVGDDPFVDVGEDLLPCTRWPPLGQLVQPGAVGDVHRDVAGAGGRDRFDRAPFPGDLLAQRGRLEQREAAVAAAADVRDYTVPPIWCGELLVDQVDEVLDVQQVANLLSGPVVADVRQRPAEVVGKQPVREHALVDASHLPGAGDHAAAVDDGP